MILGTAMKTISPPLLGPKKPDTLSSHQHTGHSSKSGLSKTLAHLPPEHRAQMCKDSWEATLSSDVSLLIRLHTASNIRETNDVLRGQHRQPAVRSLLIGCNNLGLLHGCRTEAFSTSSSVHRMWREMVPDDRKTLRRQAWCIPVTYLPDSNSVFDTRKASHRRHNESKQSTGYYQRLFNQWAQEDMGLLNKQWGS